MIPHERRISNWQFELAALHACEVWKVWQIFRRINVIDAACVTVATTPATLLLASPFGDAARVRKRATAPKQQVVINAAAVRLLGVISHHSENRDGAAAICTARVPVSSSM